MDQDNFDEIVNEVIKELLKAGNISSGVSAEQAVQLESVPPRTTTKLPPAEKTDLALDLPDLASNESRAHPGIIHPVDSEGLTALMNTTSARIGTGRAGPRARTRSLLLFQSDLAVTQDALMRDVDPALLIKHGLFQVQTKISEGKKEHLIRPDLGRQLNEEARRIISERCVKSPNVQVCVGDGLSAAAIEANLSKILPVLESGCKTARVTFGTPFFIKYCRVGVMNDIGDLIQPDVLILLIGERPGLGRADSMSAYMGYRPQAGNSDADRDVICNIYDGGGTNPLEAGAYAIEVAKKMISNRSSGIKLKLLEK